MSERINTFCRGGIISICCINKFWSTWEILTKFKNIFELYQIFQHNFYVKMPRHSHHIFLTKRINKFWILEPFVLKIKGRKIYKDFWNYIKSSQIIFFVLKWINVLTRRIKEFWIRGIRIIWAQKKHTISFELYQELKCLDILELYIIYKRNDALPHYILRTHSKSITL